MSENIIIALLGVTALIFTSFGVAWLKNYSTSRIDLFLTIFSGIATVGLVILLFLPSPSEPSTSPTVKSETIRNQVFAARDDEAAALIVSGLWYEDDSGPKSDNRYNPNGCPTKGYGLAWNVAHNNTDYTNRVIAFTKETALQFAAGGWFVRICLREGVELSALDAARIQAAVMQRSKDNTNGVVWEAQLINE
jgi:hypothetical protein